MSEFLSCKKETSSMAAKQPCSSGFWIGHNFSNCLLFSLSLSLSLSLSFSRSVTPHALSSLVVREKLNQSIYYMRVSVGVCRHDRRERLITPEECRLSKT